jgi:hypothetical protein
VVLDKLIGFLQTVNVSADPLQLLNMKKITLHQLGPKGQSVVFAFVKQSRNDVLEIICTPVENMLYYLVHVRAVRGEGCPKRRPLRANHLVAPHVH